MSFHNIFQGNKLISNAITEALQLPKNDKSYLWETETFYFQAYFYLSKRFGMPKIHDNYKDAGVWTFKVKEYKIQIYIDSTFVNIMIFGDSRYKNYSMRQPYWVAVWRKQEKVKDRLFVFNDDNELSERQKAVNEKLFSEFLAKSNIGENVSQERFNKWFDHVKQMDWYKFTQSYNADVVGVDMNHYSSNYGSVYQNSKTKRALKVLKQFLHNMLTPIYVRDVAFNIKGRCGREFDKYINNIEINHEKSTFNSRK